MMAALMYGVMLIAKMENLLNAPPEKKVQETEQIAVCEELLDRGRINSRDGDVRPHPEDGEHDQREDDLPAKFGYLKDVAKG